MENVFVTGTDTEVGKTTIAAGLLRLIHGNKPVAYWKPVQTGTVIGNDTDDVRELTELGADNFIPAKYSFAEAVAPAIAAKQWKHPINIDEIVKDFRGYQKDRFIIVEGGGGLLVPMTETSLQIELVQKLKAPVIIVSADKVGTINHTLLTVNALRAEKIPLLGVVMTKCTGAIGNAESISRYGDVEILGEFQQTMDRRTVISQVSTHPGLRKLFGMPALPL